MRWILKHYKHDEEDEEVELVNSSCCLSAHFRLLIGSMILYSAENGLVDYPPSTQVNTVC
jgi:hypothetical protein